MPEPQDTIRLVDSQKKLTEGELRWARQVLTKHAVLGDQEARRARARVEQLLAAGDFDDTTPASEEAVAAGGEPEVKAAPSARSGWLKLAGLVAVTACALGIAAGLVSLTNEDRPDVGSDYSSAGGGLGGGLGGGGGGAVGPDLDADPIGAKQACEDFVTQSLLAPATAEFPGYDEYTVTGGPNDYIVTGYVDSENGFGALIRSSWSCSTTTIDGNTWEPVVVNVV